MEDAETRRKEDTETRGRDGRKTRRCRDTGTRSGSSSQALVRLLASTARADRPLFRAGSHLDQHAITMRSEPTGFSEPVLPLPQRRAATSAMPASRQMGVFQRQVRGRRVSARTARFSRRIPVEVGVEIASRIIARASSSVLQQTTATIRPQDALHIRARITAKIAPEVPQQIPLQKAYEEAVETPLQIVVRMTVETTPGTVPGTVYGVICGVNVTAMPNAANTYLFHALRSRTAHESSENGGTSHFPDVSTGKQGRSRRAPTPDSAR